jgi:hypothetical protein
MTTGVDDPSPTPIAVAGTPGDESEGTAADNLGRARVARSASETIFAAAEVFEDIIQF